MPGAPKRRRKKALANPHHLGADASHASGNSAVCRWSVRIGHAAINPIPAALPLFLTEAPPPTMRFRSRVSGATGGSLPIPVGTTHTSDSLSQAGYLSVHRSRQYAPTVSMKAHNPLTRPGRPCQDRRRTIIGSFWAANGRFRPIACPLRPSSSGCDCTSRLCFLLRDRSAGAGSASLNFDDLGPTIILTAPNSHSERLPGNASRT